MYAAIIRLSSPKGSHGYRQKFRVKVDVTEGVSVPRREAMAIDLVVASLIGNYTKSQFSEGKPWL